MYVIADWRTKPSPLEIHILYYIVIQSGENRIDQYLISNSVNTKLRETNKNRKGKRKMAAEEERRRGTGRRIAEE